MGFFSKKKEAPAEPVNEPAEAGGPFVEIQCGVAVSTNGRTHSGEAEGSIRFYDNEIVVYGPSENPASVKNLAKSMLFGAKSSSVKTVEVMRVPYSEIARLSFPKKITARIDLRDGRYAFFVLLGSKREALVSNFAAYGVTVDPDK